MAAQTTLGKMLTGKLSGVKTPIQTQSAFLGVLGDYLSKVTLQGTFTGALTAPPNTPLPAPAQVDFSIMGAAVQLGAAIFMDPHGGPGVAEWTAWMTAVYLNMNKAMVSAGKSTAVPTPPLPAFILTVPTFSQRTLRDAFEQEMKKSDPDPQGAVIDALAKGIMDDLGKMYVRTVPTIWTAYTGMTTITKVVLP